MKFAIRWKNTALTPGYVKITSNSEVAAGSLALMDSIYFFKFSNITIIQIRLIALRSSLYSIININECN